MASPTQQYVFNLPSAGAEIDGRYRVIEQIGEGSYGWVFSVEHVLLGQTFAVKLLHPRVAADPSWVVRFREEAKSTSLISHENIVFVTDFGKCDDYGYYFVMEYLEGRTLDEVLVGEPLGLQRSLHIALQAAGALSAAHDLGIVHRDFKPGNMMLLERANGSETCKLLDFGISSIVLAAAETAKLYGTPAYMAPEQAVQTDVDHRADQFSLATIVYQMLTGRTPWKTLCWDDATPAARAAHPPTPPSELCPEVPATLDTVVLKALAVPFEQRWPNVAAFARALVAASSVSWIPQADPFDLYFAGDTEVEDTTQVSVSRPNAGESMVIVLDEGDDAVEMRPQVTARFRTAERLVREYRRNLVVGGLFLPCDDHLVPNGGIDLRLVFEPMHSSVDVRATVVAQEPCDASHPGPRGFGVAIEPADRERLTRFLRRLRLGLGLSKDDIIHPIRVPTIDEQMSAAEVFLLTRINQPMTLARIRVLSSGLPFDVEQAVQSLVEKGCLEVEAADLSSLSESSSLYEADAPAATELPTEARGAHEQGAGALVDDTTRFPWSDDGLSEASEISYTHHEVARVLAQVRYFKARHNYIGAIGVLRKALDVSPSVAVFYHELALLHARFRGDFPRAFQALHGAIQLDPQNDEYKRTLRRLEKLAGLDD